MHAMTLGAIACALLGSLVLTNPAFADDSSAAAKVAGRRFASVWRIRGEVTATLGDSKGRKLREGDPVFVGERVRAEANSEAVLKTDDAGILAVRPGSVFVAERFAAEGRPTDNITVRVLVGAMRMITGWIGRSNHANTRIVTPTATIGIRGTDHEPYVMTDELAESLAQKAGTYDKVNRGGTTLDANGSKVDIDPGKVGFVRASKPANSRALMTLVLPVILDKVPEFYVPGRFDAEMDRLAETADDNAMKKMEERRKLPPDEPVAEASGRPAGANSGADSRSGGEFSSILSPRPEGAKAAACGASGIARTWLAQLDGAIAKHQSATILRMFAPDIVVHAKVRDKDGAPTNLDIGRDEFAQSTIAAVTKLKDYKQRRPSLDGWPQDEGSCNRVAVRSVVIEQGKQDGKSYRFESIEEYLLERRDGKWVAIQAATTQR